MTIVLLEQQRWAARLKVYEDITSGSPHYFTCSKCGRYDDCFQVGTALLHDIFENMPKAAAFPLRLSRLPLRQVLKGCLRAVESRHKVLVKCCKGYTVQEFESSETMSHKAGAIYTETGLCLSCLENGNQPTDSCKHEEDKAMAGPLEST